MKKGITIVPEKKIVRHSRSLSQNKLEGESEADINYESVVKTNKVSLAHEPL